MNRPLKFRAWDGTRFKWVIFPDSIPIPQSLIWEMPMQQFTGLTDKNGKEVYEGDVVTYRDQFNNIKQGVVEWDSGGFRVESGGLFKPEEVIGNIYENPELIEKSV